MGGVIGFGEHYILVRYSNIRDQECRVEQMGFK